MNKNIQFYEDCDWYYMDFLNGSIRLPKVPGAYCIGTGCGSGKTTIIKQIASTKFNDGVIIFCKTVRECNELYDFIMQNVVDYTVGYDMYGNKEYPYRLYPDEIINLCSEPRIEPIKQVDGSIKHICTNGVNLNWKNDFSLIYKAKIVIATHYVLMNTRLDVLMMMSTAIKGNPFVKPTEVLNYDKVDTIIKGNYGIESMCRIRQFVLIDELPITDTLKFGINCLLMEIFIERNSVWTRGDSKGSIVKSSYSYIKKEYSDYGVFKEKFLECGEICPDYRIDVNGKDTLLAEDRREMLISALYAITPREVDRVGIERMRKSNNPEFEINPTIRVKYNLPTILMRGTMSHFWLFEGTGDITMKNSPVYRLESFRDKYKDENVDIIKFRNHLKTRSIDVDKMFSKKEKVLEELEKDINTLKEIIKVNKETLIVVWKYLRPKFIKTEDKDTETYLAKFTLNDEFNLPAYIEDRLIKINDQTGELNGHKFHIIHYGSGLDLSTNEFRDCDSIVRLGKFAIPNSAVNELNDDIGSRMSSSEMILYQSVQLLSRTQIRYHEGRKVRLYMSEDWDNSHFENLERYLTNEGCNVRMFDSTLGNLDKRSSNNIRKLMEYDKNIAKAILTGSKYTLNISLDNIFTILPMSRKEKDIYRGVILSASFLGITINIL